MSNPFNLVVEDFDSAKAKIASLEAELVLSWQDHEVIFIAMAAFGLGLFFAHLFGL